MALLDETDEKEKRPTEEIDGRVRAQKTHIKGKKAVAKKPVEELKKKVLIREEKEKKKQQDLVT